MSPESNHLFVTGECIMKLTSIIATGILVALSNSTFATAILSVSYANNDAIFSPTEDIAILLNVTNTGDMEANKNGGFLGSGTWRSPTGPYDNGQVFPTTGAIQPGETKTIAFYTIFAASSPVASGGYLANANYVDFRISTGPSVDQRYQLGDFRWTVSDQASVPTPATLALFGLGLAGLGWLRRKKI